MRLIELAHILPIPAAPQEIPSLDDWPSIEKDLGTPLPSDYKEFIEKYGSGRIDDFLAIFNPLSANKHTNLLARGRVERDTYTTLRTKLPHYYSHDVFPDVGGLLPFGITDNGNVLYWKTDHKTTLWSVIVYEERGPKYFAFDGNMVAFLKGVLSKELRCDVLPTNFPSERPTFQPRRVKAS
jgi:SMI1-KNR4 cell-wall